MHRNVGIALFVVVGGAVLLASVSGLYATDTLGSNVTVDPHPTNGEYVRVASTDGDEVAILINDSVSDAVGTGVNDRATTTIDDVLLVTNEGSTVTSVWTDDAAADVYFYRSTAGRPSIEGREHAVALAANETLDVGLRIDTRGDDAGIRDLDAVTFHVADGVVEPAGGSGASSDLVVRVESSSSGIDATDVLRLAVERVDYGDRLVLDESTVSGTGSDAALLSVRNVSVVEFSATTWRSGEFDLSLVGLDARPGRPRNETLAVPPAAWPGDSLPPAAFARATGRRPAGYFVADHSGSADDLRDAAVQFRVSSRYLRTVGADADATTLYRRTPGGWTAVDTDRVGRSDGWVTYEARPSKLSAFAVGVEAPAVTVSHLSAPDHATAGERVRAVATVANNGSQTTKTIALTVNGTSIATRTLTLPAGASRTVAFEPSFDEPGTYTLATGGAAETVVVASAGERPTETEPGPTPTDERSTDDHRPTVTDDGPTPTDDRWFRPWSLPFDGLLPVVVGVILLLIAVLLRARDWL